jgi:hypothetical protein
MLLGAASATAEVNWSVGINVPGVVVSVPAPVYYQAPPPAYYAPPYDWRAYRGEGWRFHRRGLGRQRLNPRQARRCL